MGAVRSAPDQPIAPTPSPSLGREGSTRSALTTATARLTLVSDTPRLDAELLMAHALGVEREALLLDPVRFAVPAVFGALVERRLAHEPIAYILGTRDFWTIRLSVGPGVLIPRADSETLIEAALDHFPDRNAPLRFLDLGTGPGTLLLAALSEFGEAHGLGIDASPDALVYAHANAATLGLKERAAFRAGNWADGIVGEFDLILCNPPYIGEHESLMAEVAHHEPPGALFAGPDGLDDYRRIIPALPALLAPDGIAILEIGWSQRAAVTDLAGAEGFLVRCRQDLGGRDRALVLSHR